MKAMKKVNILPLKSHCLLPHYLYSNQGVHFPCLVVLALTQIIKQFLDKSHDPIAILVKVTRSMGPTLGLNYPELIAGKLLCFCF